MAVVGRGAVPLWTLVLAAAAMGCGHSGPGRAATGQGQDPDASRDSADSRRANPDEATSGIAPATQQRVLFVWGGVDAGGTPHLDPAFVLDAPPALPVTEGSHRIIGRDADGAELFSLRFEMPVIADGDGSGSFVFAVPVQEGWPDRLASITLEGPGGSFTLDRESDRPMAILRDPATGQIRQIARDLPPGPAGRREAEALAAETGFELLFSRGIPDPADWRRQERDSDEPVS